jgi:hypothetical protein
VRRSTPTYAREESSDSKSWGAGAWTIPQDARGDAIAGRIKRSGNVLVAFGVLMLSWVQSSERSPTSVACCGCHDDQEGLGSWLWAPLEHSEGWFKSEELDPCQSLKGKRLLKTSVP